MGDYQNPTVYNHNSETTQEKKITVQYSMVKMTRRGSRTKLLNHFAPGKYTVLCGRGKEYTSSTGNQHLKSLVQKSLKPYSEAQSKMAKSAIVADIMGQIKILCGDAAFVKIDKGGIWWEVDDAFAREKIGKST